ncbi:ribonuclease T2-like [Tulasnella sp. 419]|nr:ribonuclease T2-like [Tulasnella sp. 419]
MNTYWLSNDGDNESFWEHEWNKHGTCMSTLKPTCLPSGSKTGLDAANYFQATIDLFKTLDTYSTLAAAGIYPSSSTTFTLSQLTTAVKAKFGYTPAFDCKSGAVNAISYYFNLKGSVIDGTWVPINAPKAGTCPSTGIKYLPKSGGSTPTSSTAGTAPTAVPSRSTVTVTRSGGTSTGCLLSYGTWSTQTCATMTATTSGNGFILTSSKGKCAIVSGALSCDSSVSSATVFTATSSSGKLLLTYGGSTAFTADSVPSGTTQVTLYSGSARSQDVTLAIIAV